MIAQMTRHYITREKLPERRCTWRQKIVIHETDGSRHPFFVDFGEYEDGRLAEIFVTMHKTWTFARGTLDAMARCVSLALQSGTSPHELAKTLRGMEYPPMGRIEAEGSSLNNRFCSSVADYIGQEIVTCYDEDGIRKE